jgi:hypothetical protein
LLLSLLLLLLLLLLLQLWTSYKGNEHVVFSPKGFAWYTKDSGW